MIQDFFNTTFTVKRMVWAVDGSGNDYSSESSVGTFLGYAQQSGPELAQYVGLAFTKTFTVYCGTDADVTEGDALIANNYRYHVKAAQSFTQGMNAHLELICEREINPKS